MGMMGLPQAGRAVEALSQAAGVMAGIVAQRSAPDYIAVQSDTASGPSPYDRAVDGLNRLPRPLLALGTLGLFVYAMVEPEGFGRRMEGLSLVPDPLWWLFGAVVSFHFGAREAHYHRVRRIRPSAGEDTTLSAEDASRS